jgi:hypothetical protein
MTVKVNPNALEVRLRFEKGKDGEDAVYDWLKGMHRFARNEMLKDMVKRLFPYRNKLYLDSLVEHDS